MFIAASLFALCHPAGTSEISDLNGDITNFWTIEVNGRIFSGVFPIRNPQKSQRSQHPFQKLVCSLKVLCVRICYQIIFKCNWARTQRKLQFCLTIPFLSISNLRHVNTNWFKLVQTGFFQSVISDPPNFTVTNPIEVSNFCHDANYQNYWLDIGQNLLSIFKFLWFLTYF